MQIRNYIFCIILFIGSLQAQQLPQVVWYEVGRQFANKENIDKAQTFSELAAIMRNIVNFALTSHEHFQCAYSVLTQKVDLNNKQVTLSSYIFSKRFNLLNQEFEQKVPGQKIENSASPSTDNPLLNYLLKGGHLDLAKKFIYCGTNVNMKDKDKNTPLLIAVENKYEEIVKLLLARNALANERNKDGNTALQLACWSSQPNQKIIDFLLKRPDIDVNNINNSGYTALRFADNKKTLNKLLAHKDIDVDRSPRTPLISAAWCGKLNKVLALLAHGADVNKQDPDGFTALHDAIRADHIDIAKILAGSMDNIDIADNNGDTPLHVACKQPSFQLVKALLILDANTEIKNKQQETALLAALTSCRESNIVEVVTTLLEHNANVNAADKNGRTVLMHAVRSGKIEVVQLLLDHGAQVDCKDNDGICAHTIAVGRKYNDIAQLLMARRL